MSSFTSNCRIARDVALTINTWMLQVLSWQSGWSCARAVCAGRDSFWKDKRYNKRHVYTIFHICCIILNAFFVIGAWFIWMYCIGVYYILYIYIHTYIHVYITYSGSWLFLLFHLALGMDSLLLFQNEMTDSSICLAPQGGADSSIPPMWRESKLRVNFGNVKRWRPFASWQKWPEVLRHEKTHVTDVPTEPMCNGGKSVSIVIAQISKCTESFFRNHFPFFGSLSLKFASSDVALSKGMCKVVVNVTKTYKDLSSWRQPQAAMLWKWSSFLQAAFWSFWCFLFGSMDLYSLSDFKWLVFSLFSSTTLVRSNRKFTHPNHPFLSHSCSGIDIYWHLESQASQQSLVIPVQTSRSLASDKPWKTALSSSGFGRSLRCSWRLGLEKVRSTHDGFGIPGVLHVVLPEVSLYRAGDCIFRFVYFDLP